MRRLENVIPAVLVLILSSKLMLEKICRYVTPFGHPCCVSAIWHLGNRVNDKVLCHYVAKFGSAFIEDSHNGFDSCELAVCALQSLGIFGSLNLFRDFHQAL